jgi:dTDP-4-amino-4,6-dideoxygalactose transaminase
MNREKRTVPLSRPKIGDEELEALRPPLESGWLTQGPFVIEFEQAFAERHQVKHAIAVTSGTTALHLGLAALGIGPGDEVIVPAFTWIATANAVLYVGAKPVFVDVDPNTFKLDLNIVASKLTGRTKAVIAVHLFGLCTDIEALRAMIPREVLIVEDAACAAGASVRSVPAGAMGDVGCFSFHPRKSITTGEGGMLTTSNDDVAALARSLRNHGAGSIDAAAGPYAMPDFEKLGFNFRMSEIQAAIGLVQLRKLDRFINERLEWAEQYRDALKELNWLRIPTPDPGFRHAWQAFVTVVDESRAPMGRDNIMSALADVGISTRPGTHAVTELSLYKKRGVRPRDFPVASSLYRRSMAIPLHNCMDTDDLRYVTDTLARL